MVDLLGRVRETLQTETGDTFIEGVLFGKVAAPTNPSPTFYARNGEVFSIACLVVSALAAAGFFLRARKLKNSACPTRPETKPSPR